MSLFQGWPNHTARGLRLLSLDGGTNRGISILIILRALMKRIQEEESLVQLPKPCDYFDLIGGTNTSGLIAILLGRLRMGVDEAMERYQQFIERVFGDLNDQGMGEQFRTTTLTRELKNLVEAVTGRVDVCLLDDRVGGDQCKIFTCSRNQLNLNSNIPVLFRSYPSTNASREHETCTIWQAAHATCATPGIFKPAILGNAQPYIDGGLGNNNPIKSVLYEASKQFPAHMVAVVASIGTGYPQTLRVSQSSPLKDILISMAADCETQHNEMVLHFSQCDGLYFRFNVEQGIQETNILQPSHGADVEAHTAIYLATQQTQRKLAEAANEIIGRRGKLAIQYLVSAPNSIRPIDAYAQLKRIAESMEHRIATRHQYHHQAKQPCHPATRDAALQKLNTWIREPLPQGTSPCLLVTGNAGVGKTAIAMTTVQCLLDRRSITAGDSAGTDIPQTEAPLLCAQYFFNYTLDSAKLAFFLNSLALQLANLSSSAASAIRSALQRRPTLTDSFGLEEAKHLFLDPLTDVAKLHFPHSVVVVVDGLDELLPQPGDSLPTTLRDVTTVFGEIVPSLPPNARLLILSRPETQIIDNIPHHVDQYHLETSESRRDVANLLDVELRQLGKVYGLTGFPTSRQYDLMCSTADGHLGWAKQAIQWLASILEYEGMEGVSEVIGQIGLLATGDLDGLYSLVLTRTLPPKGNPRRVGYISGLHQVLCVLAVLEIPQSIATINHLVNANLKVHFNVLHCLKRLSIVYATGAIAVTDTTIPRPHKSFHDFLVSKDRAPPEFWVDASYAHSLLARACFGVMGTSLPSPYFERFKVGNGTAGSLYEPHVLYGGTSLIFHVERSDGDFTPEVDLWMSAKFLFWLELMISLHRGPAIQAQLRALQSKCSSPSMALASLAKHHERHLINEPVTQITSLFYRSFNAPALYLSFLPLSPPHIQSAFSGRHIRTRSHQEGFLNALANYPCVISPTGEHVALLTSQLRILSTTSGTILWQKDTGGTKETSRIAFSSDGEFLIMGTLTTMGSGSSVRMQLFDSLTGTIVTEHLIDIQRVSSVSTIHQISVSHQATYFSLVLGIVKPRILTLTGLVFRVVDAHCLWTTESCESIRFLSDARVIMHGGYGRKLVDSSSGRLIGIGVEDVIPICRVSGDIPLIRTFLKRGPERSIFAAAFSPDTRSLALAVPAGKIEIWRRNESQWTLFSILDNHFYDSIKELAFHLDGNRLLSYSRGLIRIWDVSASVEGREFKVDVGMDACAESSWFKHGITLGGWYTETSRPFVFDYPFKLPEGVEPLNWQIDPNPEDEA